MSSDPAVVEAPSWLVEAFGGEVAARLPAMAADVVQFAYAAARRVRQGEPWGSNAFEGRGRYDAVCYGWEQRASVLRAVPIRPEGAFALAWWRRDKPSTWLYPVKYGDDAKPTIESIRLKSDLVTTMLTPVGPSGETGLFEFELPSVRVVTLAYTGTELGPTVARLGLAGVDPSRTLVWRHDAFLDLRCTPVDATGESEPAGRAQVVGDGHGVPGFLRGEAPALDLSAGGEASDSDDRE